MSRRGTRLTTAERDLARRRELEEKGKAPWLPSPGAVKKAEVEDIEAMLGLVRAEKERRRMKRRRRDGE